MVLRSGEFVRTEQAHAKGGHKKRCASNALALFLSAEVKSQEILFCGAKLGLSKKTQKCNQATTK